MPVTDYPAARQAQLMQRFLPIVKQATDHRQALQRNITVWRLRYTTSTDRHKAGKYRNPRRDDVRQLLDRQEAGDLTMRGHRQAVHPFAPHAVQQTGHSVLLLLPGKPPPPPG